MKIFFLAICLLLSGINYTASATTHKPNNESISCTDTHEEDASENHNAIHIDDGADNHNDKNNNECKDEEDEKDNETIELSPAAVKAAEIQTEIIKLEKIPRLISVPGEVIPDPNFLSKISVRISCQVEKLWVNIGETVKKGQPLVTLSSIEMAEVQAQLLDSYNNWRRNKSLVQTKTVSEVIYKKSEIEFYKTVSILISYGMSNEQVKDLLKEDNPEKITGRFIVFSPQDGKIYTDNLVLGKRFVEDQEDGNELLSIIDCSSLWVKASLSGNDINQLKVGAKTIISNERNNIEGKVIQVLPKLDPVTRTQSIIISISNINDKLHPGEFVDCSVAVDRIQPVVVVPESSVFRLADGDWAVYEEVKPNHFKQREISLIETIDKNMIISGIKSGSKIVTDGAFALHSELIKSGFSTNCH